MAGVACSRVSEGKIGDGERQREAQMAVRKWERLEIQQNLTGQAKKGIKYEMSDYLRQPGAFPGSCCHARPVIELVLQVP